MVLCPLAGIALVYFLADDFILSSNAVDTQPVDHK